VKVQFKCRRCGWCCKNKVINILYSDIIRWRNEDRKDILKEVSFIRTTSGLASGFYFRKTTMPSHKKCPFLDFENDLAKCLIQDTKPRCCKNNPEIIPRKDFLKWIGCPAFKEVHKKWIMKRSEN